MNYFISLTLVVFLLQLSSSAQAGSLVNGDWKTSNCGQKSAPPTMDTHDIDAYNKSVTAVNEWQQQSSAYLECLVKEANDDNKTIAEKANAEQAYFRKTMETIGATLEAGKNKLK